MTNRLSYIDIAKGIGIFFVIWGHIILSGPAYNFIYAFHMPLFFFLSGFVFSKNKYKNIKEFLIKKLKTLILPYMVLSIITYLYWFLIETRFTGSTNFVKTFIQIFISQGSSGYMLHNIPMWFVLCLFSLEIIYYFISKLKNNKIRYVSILLLGATGCLMTLENNFFDFRKLFWSLEIAFVALPFYAIGSEISTCFGKEKIKEIIESKNKVLTIFISIILFIILLITSNLNPDVSMGTDYLGNFGLFYINAFFGIVLTIIISILIEKNKLFEFLGKRSFFIMATHFPIRKPIVLLFSKMLKIGTQVIYSNIFYSLVIAIVTLILEIIIIKILEKMKIFSKLLNLQNKM